MGRRTHDEQDLHNWRDPSTAIQSQAASRQWPQQPRETPWAEERSPWECRRGESTMEPMRTQQPRETPMDRGEITMKHRRREFTMEPMRMSPMQPRQRQKSHKYSSTTSPYNTDRTARIKGTNSVATQTDSFQDHLGKTSKLVHIDSFQDPSYMATFDSFQDHLEEEFRKLMPIDSFQHHFPYNKSWLLSRPSQWPIQKPSEIDSFQDPCDLQSNWLVSGPYVHIQHKNCWNWLLSRPLHWIA